MRDGENATRRVVIISGKRKCCTDKEGRELVIVKLSAIALWVEALKLEGDCGWMAPKSTCLARGAPSHARVLPYMSEESRKKKSKNECRTIILIQDWDVELWIFVGEQSQGVETYITLAADKLSLSSNELPMSRPQA
jgi:hypothetical protein